jgi:DNA repair exonuclease SbcCD ATPase subunit
LDEIFSSLDPKHSDNVIKMLDDVKEEFTRVILISHEPEINEIIQNKILIEKGEGNAGLSKIKSII